MLDLMDERWKGLEAGYRLPIDLRPILQRLESEGDDEAVWQDLWEELYHQGDVGAGSFAAVPHLVRIHRLHGNPNWNTYALVATIELARGRNGNPEVPDWARAAYDRALRDLAQIGLEDLPRASDQEAVRSILGMLAITYGARTYGRILVELSEDEVLELEKHAFGSSEDAG